MTAQRGLLPVSGFRSFVASFPRLIWGIALLAVLIRVALALTTHFTGEDYLITLRYAENLAQGRGMVYNPGERVLGTTTPLYTLFLALFTWLKLPATACGKLLNILADGALCLVMYAWMQEIGRRANPVPENASSDRDSPPAFSRHANGIVAALWIALNPVSIQWSISGMESGLVTLCGAWAILLWMQRRLAGMYATLAVLFLLRWDSLLLIAVLTLAILIRDRRLPLRELTLFALLIAPWLLFATAYYGNPIPITGQAKMIVYGHRADSMSAETLRRSMRANGSWHSAMVAWEPEGLLRAMPQQQNLLYCLCGTPAYAFALFCALLGLARARRHRWSELAPPVAWLLLYWLAFLFSRVLLFGWYLLPTLPVYGALFALGLTELAERIGGRWPVALQRGLVWGATTILIIVVPTLLFRLCRETQAIEDNERRPLGLWLKAHSLPSDRIMLEPIGYIGYYSGRPILDAIGLVSPEVLSAYTDPPSAPFLTIARRYKPEWCVLRPGELQAVQAAAKAEGHPWETDYQLAQTFAYTPRKDRDLIIFYIFRRKSSASTAPPAHP